MWDYQSSVRLKPHPCLRTRVSLPHPTSLITLSILNSRWRLTPLNRKCLWAYPHVWPCGVFENCLRQCALHFRMKTTAVHFAGCYFPHRYVEALLFTEHFSGCYFPRRFTICVFISLDNTEINLHMPPVYTWHITLYCICYFTWLNNFHNKGRKVIRSDVTSLMYLYEKDVEPLNSRWRLTPVNRKCLWAYPHVWPCGVFENWLRQFTLHYRMKTTAVYFTSNFIVHFLGCYRGIQNNCVVVGNNWSFVCPFYTRRTATCDRVVIF
jgi:hypothetical protein